MVKNLWPRPGLENMRYRFPVQCLTNGPPEPEEFNFRIISCHLYCCMYFIPHCPLTLIHWLMPAFYEFCFEVHNHKPLIGSVMIMLHCLIKGCRRVFAIFNNLLFEALILCLFSKCRMHKYGD